MDFEKVVNELAVKALENNGVLVQDDLLAYCELNSDEYDHLIELLEEKNVNVVPKEEEIISIVESDLEAELIPDDKIEDIVKNTSYDDPVRVYLKQIGQYRLLDAETEKNLALDVAKGAEAKAMLESHEYDDDIEKINELQKQIKKAERAKDRLVTCNLRLVVSIAKKYTQRGLDLLDLIQEGSLGLTKSVDKFELNKGFKFSTYATWWIRQAITRAIADKGRTIRIPVHMVENINKYYKCNRELTAKLGRIPTIEEIANEMGLTADKILQIQRIAQEPVSLEKPVGEEEDSTYGDFIPDSSATDPYEFTFETMKEDALNKALSELTPREERVIRLRYGFTPDGRERTLEEVGEEFGLTRERIRQIQAKAIQRLRQHSKRALLKDYIDN